MENTIISLVGGIILRLIFPEPTLLLNDKEPDFISNIPPAHYVGISSLHQDVSRAKDEAILDAVKQIFRVVGTEYQIEFSKNSKRTTEKVSHDVNENITSYSKGVLNGLHVKKICIGKNKKRLRVYVLVFFPPSKILLARQKIEKENRERMEEFNLHIKKGGGAKDSGQLEKSLKYYRFALGLTDNLFTTRKSSKRLAEANIDDVLELIAIREQRLKEEALKRPSIRVSPLTVTDKAFVFEISEVNGKDAVFDKYSIDIHADYNFSKAINYYVMKIDNENNLKRTFDFLKHIKVKANSTRFIMIPFNSWVKNNLKDIDSYILGSKVSYNLALFSNDLRIIVR